MGAWRRADEQVVFADGADRVFAAVLEEAGGPPVSVTLEELRGAPADDDDDDESESRSPV